MEFRNIEFEDCDDEKVFDGIPEGLSGLSRAAMLMALQTNSSPEYCKCLTLREFKRDMDIIAEIAEKRKSKLRG